MELRFATLDQIVDELERRYGCVLIGIHKVDPGTLMCKRGDITVAWGIHRELEFFLKEHWDKVPLRGVGDGN
jgi:hypothetical protein